MVLPGAVEYMSVLVLRCDECKDSGIVITVSSESRWLKVGLDGFVCIVGVNSPGLRNSISILIRRLFT